MEIGNKAIAAGIGLFCLGGLSVYLLMTPAPEASDHEPTSIHQGAGVQAEQVTIPGEASDTPEMTHAAFLAEAEARREQYLENKAEAERLEKLRVAMQNSVECKFWKQQQKTSSAAAKIEGKINQYCNLSTSAGSESSSAAAQ